MRLEFFLFVMVSLLVSPAAAQYITHHDYLSGFVVNEHLNLVDASCTSNLVTTGHVTIDSDSSLLRLGAEQDYSIRWYNNNAVHTISAGDFVFAGGSVLVQAGGIKFLRNESSGWSRGIHCYTSGALTTELAGIGIYGNAASDPDMLYMTFGDDPHTSSTGIIVKSTGRVGFGTVAPDAIVEIAGTLQVGDGDTDTDYTSISATGNQTFAGAAGFYPHVLSQDGEPAAGTGATQIDSGELMIWIDTNDSNKVYLVYNNGGTVVTELLD